MQFTVKIKDGAFVFKDEKKRAAYVSLVSSYSNSGKSLVISIVEFSRNITDSQLGLYHAMITEGAKESGHTFSQFKQQIEDMFCPYKHTKDFMGKIVSKKITVAEMDNMQFNDFFGQASAFVNEFFGTNF